MCFWENTSRLRVPLVTFCRADYFFQIKTCASDKNLRLIRLESKTKTEQSDSFRFSLFPTPWTSFHRTALLYYDRQDSAKICHQNTARYSLKVTVHFQDTLLLRASTAVQILLCRLLDSLLLSVETSPQWRSRTAHLRAQASRPGRRQHRRPRLIPTL